MSDGHEWCRDVRRDEQVRAAEDAAAVPSIQHRDLPEQVSLLWASLGDLIGRVVRLEGEFDAGQDEEAAPAVCDSASPAEGLRTERVTLEVTQRAESYAPLFEIDWESVLRQMHRGGRSRGESVRVVGTHAEAVAESVAWEGARNAFPGRIARLTAERDAAIRERDAAIRERDEARAECERLRDVVRQLSVDQYRRVPIQRNESSTEAMKCMTKLRRERDAAQSQCEELERAALVDHQTIGTLRARVAELERDRRPATWQEEEAAVEGAWLLCGLEPDWPSDEPGTIVRHAESMRREVGRLRDRVAELEATAAAANAGGEVQ